ncbi:MAG: pitrilysin family protein [bacterium]
MNKKFDPYDFSKKEINGVPVYYKNLPWAPCIHICIVFNNGAFNDPVGKEGLSHFLEHLLLKGCPSIPSKKAIREWSKINALNTLNAWTNFYNTCYFLKCLPEKYDTVLIGLKDMIFNSYLKSEDIEEERKVIVQEAWGQFLNNKFLVYIKEFCDIFYYGNQHSRFSSSLGWPETILKISQEDIVSWHKKNYGIGNFYVVIVGAIEEMHIDKLEDFLGDLPKVEPSFFDFGEINKPKQNKITKTADEIGEVKEQVEISIVRLLEKIDYEKDEISNVSTRLMRDLLNEKLRTEHSLCYGVLTSLAKTKLCTRLSVNVKTDEKNIELVEKEIKNVIEEIINKKHLERFNTIKILYKEQLKSQEFFSDDIATNTIYEISRFNGHIVTNEEQLKNLEKVTYDDVVDFTSFIFDSEYLLTEIILPSKK